MACCTTTVEVEKLQCKHPVCKPRTAGKVWERQGCIKECMIYAVQGPDFDNSIKTPDYVPNITHGNSSNLSQPAGELINPRKKSNCQKRLSENKDFIYRSKIFPLEKCRKPVAYDESFVPDNTMLFGEMTVYEEPLGKLVNPPKSYEQVLNESAIGHKNYVMTHNDYNVGEMVNRGYNWGGRNPQNIKFGKETPHFNNGRNMANTMKWVNFKPADRHTRLVSSKWDTFQQRFQPQIGKVLDPISDTMKVGPDFTFGAPLRPDKYSVGDLMHMRDSESLMAGRDLQRGWLACIRHHLKMANYHNFDGLESAFRFYDSNNTGFIEPQNLSDACWKLNLPIDDKQLRVLMQFCCCVPGDKPDNDKDFKIDYIQFVNFLNWQQKYDTLMPPDNPRLENDEEKEKATVLIRQIDKAIGNHFTMNSLYDHTIPYKASLNVGRTNGIPTVRSDIPAPRIRRLSDRVNYGDESDAHGLIHPSIFSTHGVYDRDFFKPRSRIDIRKIFEAIGVKMSEETFNKVWNFAVGWSEKFLKKNQKDKVCVEAFRAALDTAQGTVIFKAEEDSIKSLDSRT